MKQNKKQQHHHNRYFQRQSFQTRLRFFCLDQEGSMQQEGLVGNRGDGGIYFETGQYLKTGTRLHLLIDEPASGQAKGEPQMQTAYLATVRWCNRLQSPLQPAYPYGVGAHFVSNECEWCREIVPYEKIYWTQSGSIFCKACLRDLEGLNSGRLKRSVTNHLLGNVI